MRYVIAAVLAVVGLCAAKCLAADVVFSGKVVDAKTGDPVEKFTIQEGWAIGKDQQIGWGGTQTSSRNADGAFKVTQQWPTGQKVWLRIIADGYAAQPVTPDPVTSPATVTDLVVKLTRGNSVSARVLDHRGEPVPDASIFLVGTQPLALVDGKPDAKFGTFTGTKTITDKEGRFTLTGAGAENDRIVVVTPGGLAAVSPVAQLVAGAQAEFVIRLPEPATLTLRYEIPGAPEEGQFRLQLKTWDMADWKGVGDVVRQPKIINTKETVVENLTPGTYDLGRTKSLRSGQMGKGVFIDRQDITLAAGGMAVVDFVRKTGLPITGEIVGVNVAEVDGVYIYVKSPQATGDPRATDEWKLRAYEAVTCNADGKFKTELILPGEYAVTAEAYRVETAEVRMRSGWRLPAFTGIAKVTVPATGEMPLVRIELVPLVPQQPK